MKSTLRIAVIGAGPGGLLCARVLQRHGIDVAVYDTDASIHARDPGGTLDLHADTGQIALHDAGLFDEFLALSRPEGQAKSRVDQHGTVISAFTPGDDDVAAPEIDRGQLRALLAENVEPGTVRWDHKLLAATPLGDGTHRLEFANGTTTEVDLVIGADGAWSRVRRLVSDAVPRYTGVSFLDVHFDDSDHRHPEIAKIVGDGHMFAGDGAGSAIIGQRNSDGRIRAYLGLTIAADWPEKTGIDLADTAGVRAFLREEFDGWSPELLAFIGENDGEFVHRPIYALPAPLTWPHTPGVTLLGDAAHLMTPWGGFGVNLAMLDGAELARALVEEDTADAAITRYEAEMLPRSGEHAVSANDALDRFFAVDGADPGTGPDHEAEHRRWVEGAAEYRRRQASPGTAGPFDGLWTLKFQTPGGEKHAALSLSTNGNTVTGSLDGASLEDGRVDGDEIGFTSRLTSPVKLKIKCTASVDGDTMTGKAKATMMSLAFTATREAR
jgi:2-polyprenyl-6-methoxyphenol hydroxylase-like FAD-dependent oxidoreductase